MKNRKEYYEKCLIALKEINEKGSLTEKECKRITGVFFKEVSEELKEKNAAYNIGYGDLERDDNANILIETKYYERKIKEIEDEEYRIELDNKSKVATIRGTRIAKWALWLSLLSLTGIVQQLFELLYDFIFSSI